MGVEFEIKKPRDLNSINVNDTGELLWWSHYLGISPETLLSIIHQVGNTVSSVKKHLSLKEG